jgi:hypothetical protein
MAQCGWKYHDLVDRLEEKRKIKSKLWYERKLKKIATLDKAVSKNGNWNQTKNALKLFGY